MKKGPEGMLQGHGLVKHLSGFVEHRHSQGDALQILEDIAFATKAKGSSANQLLSEPCLMKTPCSKPPVTAGADKMETSRATARVQQRVPEIASAQTPFAFTLYLSFIIYSYICNS